MNRFVVCGRRCILNTAGRLPPKNDNPCNCFNRASPGRTKSASQVCGHTAGGCLARAFAFGYLVCRAIAKTIYTAKHVCVHLRRFLRRSLNKATFTPAGNERDRGQVRSRRSRMSDLRYTRISVWRGVIAHIREITKSQHICMLANEVHHTLQLFLHFCQ